MSFIARGGNNIMLSEERYAKIIEILQDKNFIKISEMMRDFGVSHETARRDLEALQEKGIAKRVHGGAVYTPQVTLQAKSDFAQFRSENQVVAEAAAKLVKPGMSVYLDNGRTMTYLASNLKNTKNLSIVTVNLLAVTELSSSKDIDLYLLGGKVEHDEFLTTGKQTERNFKSYNFDILFRSCAGVNLSNGYISDYDDFGLSWELLREHTKKLVLVMNSGKLNKEYFSNLFSLKDVDAIVVDSNITPEQEEALREFGVELIIAPMEQQ